MDKRIIQSDLNLIKAFHVLMEERNVARAAEKLFITPSAMSKSLGRLRELFGDPLLIRTPHGLVPTARAEELSRQTALAMANITGLLKPPDFDPRSAKGRIRITSPEYFLTAIIPDLVLYLREHAPQIKIDAMHLPDDYLEMLAAGSIDFAIHVKQPYPEEFQVTDLCSAYPKLWFNESHPLRRRRKITFRDFFSYPIVAYHTPNIPKAAAEQFYRTVNQAGLEIDIVMYTSHPIIALDLLSKSDAIMLGPEFLSVSNTFSRGVKSKSINDIPEFKNLKMDICLIQHKRTLGSQICQWFTNELESWYRKL